MLQPRRSHTHTAYARFCIMLCFCLDMDTSLQLPMWVDNDSMGDPEGFLAPPSGLFPAPLPPVLGSSKDGTDGVSGPATDSCGGSGGRGSGTISSGLGKSKDREKTAKALAQRHRSVIGRFKFLGRLAARCLMDGQVWHQEVLAPD